MTVLAVTTTGYGFSIFLSLMMLLITRETTTNKMINTIAVPITTTPSIKQRGLSIRFSDSMLVYPNSH